MKTTLQALTATAFTFALFASPLLAADPTPSMTPTVKQYTCTMHPEVIQDAPGKCPKCGMKLVEKKTGPTAEPTK